MDAKPMDTRPKIKITERGWVDRVHLLDCIRCRFCRNTLIEGEGERCVVSTLGARHRAYQESLEPLDEMAGGIYYETRACEAFLESYRGAVRWSGDGERDVPLDGRVQLCADSASDLPADADQQANDMHDAAVAEIVARIGGCDEDANDEA